MSKFFTSKFLFVVLIIVLASISRLIPHLPNFTPVAAIALFGSTLLNDKKSAVLLPLIILFISDLFIGLYHEIYVVYISFIFTSFLGFQLRKKLNIVNLSLASFASSIIFFIITNFAVWVMGNFYYPMNINGLILCYEKAIPFFRNELIGTFLYNMLFFGLFYLAKIKFPSIAKV